MMSAMSYPVSLSVERQLGDRDRLTTAFRVVYAIPHLLLVGGIGVGFASNRLRPGAVSLGGETGLLGSIAFALAVISWFTIVITHEHYTPIRRYTHFYLRWRVRSLAYLMLLADVYPPFGDGAYPIALHFDLKHDQHDRVSVGFRIILAIPHFFALFVIVCAWWITSVIAWCAILITGRYPEGLYEFGMGALRWLIRVEAYVLLMVDEYPPFSLE